MISLHRSFPRTVIELESAVSMAVFASPFLPISMVVSPRSCATIGSNRRADNFSRRRNIIQLMERD